MRRITLLIPVASTSHERQVSGGRGASNRGGHSGRTGLAGPPNHQAHTGHTGYRSQGSYNSNCVTPTATTRGPPIGAEDPTEAEGMPEAEVTAESEDAATTWEVSLAGGGGGPGAAGNVAS
jgi:hypothetical protein